MTARFSHARRAPRALLVGVLVLPLLLAPSAGAQLTGSVDAEAFRPAPGPMDGFVVQRSTPEPHFAWAVRLFFDYAHEPLVLRRDGEIVERIIEHRLGAHLLGSVGFLDILEVGLGLPFVLVQTGDTSLSLGALSTAAVGDLHLDLKAAWPERLGGMFGIALGATVRFGTGDAESFSGEGTAGFDPRLILDLQTDWFGIALDFGFDCANAAIALPVEDELTMRWASCRWPTWQAGTSAAWTRSRSGAHPADPFAALNRCPLEALGGVRWRHPGGLIVSGGAGGGITRGYTSPDARVFLEIGYAAPPPPSGPPDADGDGIPDDDDRCPMEEEDEDDFQDEDGCPDPDNDGDGILDDDDDCPTEKEDIDRFEDDDGCPDPDNDGDGILDDDDDCPDAAETVNGVEDDDGCPEGDRDGDTIVDGADRCPDEAEDHDDFADDDGCPDPDNDGDGLIDVDDDCPDEPETAREDDGCPISPAAWPDRDPPIQSHNSDGSAGELPGADDVASIMEAHRDPHRVEGHDTRVPRHNLDLSRTGGGGGAVPVERHDRADRLPRATESRRCAELDPRGRAKNRGWCSRSCREIRDRACAPGFAPDAHATLDEDRPAINLTPSGDKASGTHAGRCGPQASDRGAGRPRHGGVIH